MSAAAMSGTAIRSGSRGPSVASTSASARDLDARSAMSAARSDRCGLEPAVDEHQPVAIDRGEGVLGGGERGARRLRVGPRRQRRRRFQTSARRSVYFHSSTRRCGRPSLCGTGRTPRSRSRLDLGAAGQPVAHRGRSARRSRFRRRCGACVVGAVIVVLRPRPRRCTRRSPSPRARAPAPCRPERTILPAESTWTKSGTMWLSSRW